MTPQNNEELCIAAQGGDKWAENALEVLKQRNPASIRLCTLLDKPERRVKDVKVDYVCFNIPDEFVVGYGLDYAQKYRNLPFIGVVEF